MPRRYVFRDLKERIPYLRYGEGFSVKEIGKILGVKKSMIYQTLKYHQNHGVTYNPTAFSTISQGRPRILTSDDLSLIRSLLSQNPCIYLDELKTSFFAVVVLQSQFPPFFGLFVAYISHGNQFLFVH